MKVGIFGLLGLLFIALKLIGVIAWSWWWVLAPVWMPPLVVVLFILGLTIEILWEDAK